MSQPDIFPYASFTTSQAGNLVTYNLERRMSVENTQEVATATIAANAALSGAVYCGGLRPNALQTPSSWTTTTALTFQSSADGTTWANVYDAAGNEYTVTCSTSRYILLDSAAFKTTRFLKIRTGTSSAAVVQSSGAAILVIMN